MDSSLIVKHCRKIFSDTLETVMNLCLAIESFLYTINRSRD